MVENQLTNKIKTAYFVLIATMMYYFITEIINLGIFVTFRHAFALVLAASGLIVFLFKPNIARGIESVKCAFFYSMPLLVTIMASLFIWFTNTVDTAVISRGLSGAFIYSNMLSFALASAAFLYIFGEKGIWYNLIAILAANILMIGTIIIENGIGNYFRELIELITTFAAKTGDIIVQAEIHELAFCLGAYLIYMFMKPRKDIVFIILVSLTLFCFLSAFKRIGIIAIVIALALGWLLKLLSKLNEKLAFRTTVFLGLLLVAALICYVALIKMGAFELLEKAGIDTSGRVEIYNEVDKYYEFSPSFLGNGIGFLTYSLSTSGALEVSSVHNDFLQYFIDLGFWGYILWLLSMTVFRICYFGAKGKTDNAITVFVLTVYLIIVSTTDNTMNYPLLTAVLAILMAGCGFDERVRQKEQKMFGYISNENRKKEGEFLI